MIKKIGLLYSLSGTIAIVGAGQLEASLLAIEEINKRGAVTFEPVVRDAQSNPAVAAREAYNLFTESKIDILVGCYMSSVRNSVLPVLNETGGLLLYPTVYEGEQIHPNTFYLGAVPNQQVDPVLSWAIHHLTDNFVLVGSDYIYPRATNKKVKQWIENAGGRICMEQYFPLGCRTFGDFFPRLQHLSKSVPSFVIFSTIVGTSVVDFYKQYKQNRFSLPIISPITSEREIKAMGKEYSCGHICTSSYFQTIDSEVNTRFVSAFKQRFGDQPISREMAASYEAIHMLSRAYERFSKMSAAGKERQKVLSVLKSLSFEGLQGKVIMDPKTQHLWQWSRIGRVAADGNIHAFWTSPGPVPPKHDIQHGCLAITEPIHRRKARNFGSLIGENPVFLECIQNAKIAAKTSANVLITGDTGTGKELLAKAIHRESPRSHYAFIAINCATIPRELISSELFGYEEGAFTGAKKGGKPGKIEMASGGTLFLDEISEMSTQMQASLLRVIEEKEICRLGGTKPIRFNVRLIASTNKDLHKAIDIEHSFRRDLYYRLSVFHIHLPQLRERVEDISLLAEYLLKGHNVKNASNKRLHPDTVEILTCYSWPGNIRELANIIESAFYLSHRSSVIHPENLPKHVLTDRYPRHNHDKDISLKIDSIDEDSHGVQKSASNPIKNVYLPFVPANQLHDHRISSIKENERSLLITTLAKSGYNISRAAGLLGISRSTFYRKAKIYNIDTKWGYPNK